MRIGVDAQLVAGGNRSGLYWHLRHTTRELRQLLGEHAVVMFADEEAGSPPRSESNISALLDGATVSMVRQDGLLRRALRRWSEPNRVDVLWHNLPGWLAASTYGANAFLVPDVIPLVIDYGVPGFVEQYRPFYERAAREGDVIIVFSEHAGADFRKYIDVQAERVRVAPLAAGAEFHRIDDRARLEAVLGPLGLAPWRYVLFVSTIEVRKNHATLLRAFAKLRQVEPNLDHKLVFVGSKWIGSEKVFDLVAKLNLSDHVCYLGYCDDLVSLYSGADLFVFPSLYEGFGLPPLEAMACGVPVIAANSSSLPEVVGDAGVLVDPTDVDGMAEAMRSMLLDRPRHEQYSVRGLARSRQFTWRKTAEIYLDAFHVAMQRKRGRGD